MSQNMKWTCAPLSGRYLSLRDNEDDDGEIFCGGTSEDKEEGASLLENMTLTHKNTWGRIAWAMRELLEVNITSQKHPAVFDLVFLPVRVEDAIFLFPQSSASILLRTSAPLGVSG